MKANAFNKGFTRSIIPCALFIAWISDHSNSHLVYANVVIAVLLFLICICIGLLCANWDIKLPVSKLTAKERQNAALFRHYPKSANFRVRTHASGRGFDYQFKRSQ